MAGLEEGNLQVAGCWGCVFESAWLGLALELNIKTFSRDS